jgi:hypothetical protein
MIVNLRRTFRSGLSRNNRFSDEARRKRYEPNTRGFAADTIFVTPLTKIALEWAALKINSLSTAMLPVRS